MTSAIVSNQSAELSLSMQRIVSRRVELVLLHPTESEPKGTIHWLKARPHLARHHHARISHPKVRLSQDPFQHAEIWNEILM